MRPDLILISYSLPYSAVHQLEQNLSTFFTSRDTEQGAKIVKAHHKFFKERFYSLNKRLIRLCLKLQ